MAKLIDEISVFFPAYNLEKQIIPTVRKAYQTVPKLAGKYEIIVINDGSKDKTGETLLQLKNRYKDLRIINHEINRGYGGALKSGFYSAKYKWIAFADGDGQFDIGELAKLINKQKETQADAVIGYYKKRQVSRLKIITSKIWELVVYALFGLHVKDIDCGFKLISKKIFVTIPKLESERGAFISSELLIKIKREKFKIAEIGVTHLPRIEGKGTGRDFKVIINSFVDLFRLWKKLGTTL